MAAPPVMGRKENTCRERITPADHQAEHCRQQEKINGGLDNAQRRVPSFSQACRPSAVENVVGDEQNEHGRTCHS